MQFGATVSVGQWVRPEVADTGTEGEPEGEPEGETERKRPALEIAAQIVQDRIKDLRLVLLGKVVKQRREQQPQATQVFMHAGFCVRELLELIERESPPLKALLLKGNTKKALVTLLETSDTYAPHRGLLDRNLLAFFETVEDELEDDGECARAPCVYVCVCVRPQ